jgi:hypothetical protein
MQIKEIFKTKIEERIEPIIKVGERQDEAKLAAEIKNYVVTPTIEKYLDDLVEHYTDTLRSSTTEIGVWISGYFGSGKSHLAKIAALLIENRNLEGTSATKIFETRIPSESTYRNSIIRNLGRINQCYTSVLAFNINGITDDKNTPLAKLLLSQYYLSKGYSQNLVYARVIESELDKQGKLAQLHHRIEELAKKSWKNIQNNLSFYSKHLYQAACEVVPEVFSSTQAVQEALKTAEQGDLYNAQFLVRTLLDDLEIQEKQLGKPCRFLLVLDESGQWIEDNAGRLSLLQAFIEEAAAKGQGKIWVIVTTHEDMGAVYDNARALKADMKKIEGRFRFKFSLTTENIGLVLEDRIFKKTIAGTTEVKNAYNGNSGVLRDLGELKNTNQRLPECNEEKFTTFYPFLPYQINLIPEIVKSLRSSGGRAEQLSGSTRTLLGIVQDILAGNGRRNYLNGYVGEVVSFDEVYHNLANNEVNPDHRDEIKRVIEVVPNGNLLTQRVVEVLYLIGQIKYIPKTVDNLARLLVEHTTDDLTSIINKIKPELDKLIKATIVAKIGDNYEFLTGEKRTFEKEVSEEVASLRVQDLEAGMTKFASSDVLGFSNIPFKAVEFQTKIYLDDNVVTKEGFVEVKVYSPLAAITHKVAELESTSLEQSEQKTIFVLCDRIPGFDVNLKYYLAMQRVIDRWKGDPQQSEEARKLASERESNDLNKLSRSLKAEIQKGLKQATVIFRGSARTITVKPGQTPGDAVRSEIATFFPTLYPKYEKVPVRIINEQKAILSILNGEKTLSTEIQELKLFDKSGQIDLESPLLDAIRVFLSTRQSKSERTFGKDLLNEFVQPPYGWDAGVIRVGVAALVRSAVLKVLIDKKPYTNPADTQLQSALRVSREFDKVDLVLEETEPDLDVLSEVRQAIIKLTGNRKIDETPSAISEAMEKFGNELLAKAEKTELWATPANLPLPETFIDGKEVFAKIVSLTNAMHRVNEIHSYSQKLPSYVEGICSVDLFVEKWGKAFTEMRDFAATISTIEYRLPQNSDCVSFLKDWETTKTQAKFTDKQVWQDLQTSQQTANLNFQKIINDWREEARNLAVNAIEEIPQKLAEYNLPIEELRDLLTKDLNQFLTNLDGITTPSHIAGLPEQARELIRKLDAAIQQEKNRRHSPTVGENRDDNGGYQVNSSVKQIRISAIAQKTRIQNLEQWYQIREQLDEAIKQELENGNEVELG